MFTVSESLQRARLDQGIDLATVAARTKIDAKYLRAIEADDRKSLPGVFFYKSFVHQYATFLGLDTIAIDAEVNRVLSAEDPLPLPGTVRESAGKPPFHSLPVAKYLSYAAFVLILLASASLDSWWHNRSAQATEKVVPPSPIAENTMPRSAPGPAAKPASPPADPQVAARPAVGTQEEPATPAASKVELALTATEDTWLSISSDGTQVFSGLLEANQTKTVEGKEKAEVRVGNAAGLEVRLNGTPLGPLGAHGQVRDLAFTGDKFQFVSQANQTD